MTGSRTRALDMIFVTASSDLTGEPLASSGLTGEPLTRTPVSGARDTPASSGLTGEPLTRTPVSGARDTRVTTRTCEEMRVTTRTCEEMICVIASSDLTGEPRETRIASQDTDAAPELDEGHRRSMHEKEEGKGREG